MVSASATVEAKPAIEVAMKTVKDMLENHRYVEQFAESSGNSEGGPGVVKGLIVLSFWHAGT